MIAHILSSLNVTVYVDGKGTIVPNGTAQYDLILKAIADDDVQAVRDALNIRQAVVNSSFGRITLDGTTLKYDGYPLHGSLVNRILTVFKEAGNAAPLILFLENLMQNPSKRAVDELYGFLEACNLPITDDGHFLAYKKVNEDYTSIHDGKTDNSIGSKPSLPRNQVDEDKDRTCSSGLHFCSKSYLPNFGSGWGNNRIVVVKINPADVVAIPSDYNNAKGRAWTYEIIDELPIAENGGEATEIKAGFENKYAAKSAPTPAPITVKVVGKGSLTDAQVREIRGLLDEEWPLVSIAKLIKTSERTVARIRDGETYTHVV